MVRLLDPQKRTENAALIENYRPNVVVRSNGGVAVWDLVGEENLGLHPDICLLFSTSVTTGASKSVKLSYDIGSNAYSIAEYLKIEASDRAISSLKRFYSCGMSVINSHVALGAAIALTDASLQEPDPSGWLLEDGDNCPIRGITERPPAWRTLTRLPEP